LKKPCAKSWKERQYWYP